MAREKRAIQLDDGPLAAYVIPVESAPDIPTHERYADALAKKVRTIYCLCVRNLGVNPTYGDKPIPSWDGGVTRFGTNKQPIWPKIAEVILQVQADPLAYIRAQFQNITDPRNTPKPNMLYNAAALQRWQQYKADVVIQLRRTIASDLNQIKINVAPLVVNLGWDENKALNYALRNTDGCRSTPLIRYCVATQAGLSVASAFREAALLQYLFQMGAYDEVLTDRIPAELRAEAVELHHRLAGR